MKRLILYSLLVGLLLTSCSTLRKSTAASERVRTNVQQYPTVADLDVHPKVEKTVTWHFTLFKFAQPDLNLRKGNLIADIVKENGADVLLEPQVTYTKVPFGIRKLTITGFPASFKDFRKATEADLKAIEVVVEENTYIETSESRGGFFQRIISKFK